MDQKFISNFFMICMFLIGTANIYSVPPYSNNMGTGSFYEPFQISDEQDLDLFTTDVNSGHNFRDTYFILVNDITTDVTTMIGNDRNYFQGHFDGNNKKIKVAISSNLPNVGLFSQLENGSIYNLVLDGFVSGDSSNQNVGGIAGKIIGGDFGYCTNFATVMGGSGSTVGGIFGSSPGVIGNSAVVAMHFCSNNGVISGGFAVAGIIGFVGSAFQMEVCRNAGTICRSGNTNPTYMAGIIGYTTGEHVKTTHNLVNIGKIMSRNATYSGGIVAYLSSSYNATILFFSVNAGIVDGATNSVGGIVGFINALPGSNIGISECLNTNWVEPIGTYRGAIVGRNAGGLVDINNCYYDNQMCILGGINNVDVIGSAEGRPTANMIGNSLGSPISSSSTPAQLYPLPGISLYANLHPIELLAMAPIYLPVDTAATGIITAMNVSNVTSDFYVSNDTMLAPPLFTTLTILDDPYFFQWGWHRPVFKSFSLYNYVEIVTPNVATIRSRLGWDSLAVRLTSSTYLNYEFFEKIVPINVR